MRYARLITILLLLACLAPIANAQVALTWPGKWFIQQPVSFANQQYFQQTFTFDRTVYTQKLQIAYSCTDCVGASIDVSLPDGTQLMPSIWFDGTVPSSTQEWTIYPAKVNSIILTISAEQPQGLIRFNVMGTDTRSASPQQ